MPRPSWSFLRISGTTSPGTYFTVGFVLTLIKQGLDRVVASSVF